MELDRILRLPKVVEVTGLSVASLYRRMDEKTFPLPVRLGKNSVGWRQSALQAWIDSLEEVQPKPESGVEGKRPGTPSRSRRTRGGRSNGSR